MTTTVAEVESWIMLDLVLTDARVIARYRSSPLFGPFLDGLVANMLHAGYPRMSARRYAKCCSLFGEFLGGRGVAIEALSDQHVAEFVRTRPKESLATAVGWEERHRPPLRVLVGFLRETGILVQPRAPKPLDSQHADLVEEYAAFLRDHRGLRDGSIRGVLRHVTRFLKHIEPTASMSSVSAEQIDLFLCQSSKTTGRRSMAAVASSLRGFLRYLRMRGRVPRDLAVQVSGPRLYALETVPRSLAWTDVERVLVAPDRSTKVGRRDHAILLLLAMYGLRAGEVTDLALEDLDWSRNTVQIRQSKTGEPRIYPLHSRTGNAILEYLRDGRPSVRFREVFLTTNAPIRPFARGSSLGTIVQKHMRRARVEPARQSTHVLRHSVAVHLMRSNFSLKVIGDLLGHRRCRSTYTYTKAAVDDLRKVAVDVGELFQ